MFKNKYKCIFLLYMVLLMLWNSVFVQSYSKANFIVRTLRQTKKDHLTYGNGQLMMFLFTVYINDTDLHTLYCFHQEKNSDLMLQFTNQSFKPNRLRWDQHYKVISIDDFEGKIKVQYVNKDNDSHIVYENDNINSSIKIRINSTLFDIGVQFACAADYYGNDCAYYRKDTHTYEYKKDIIRECKQGWHSLEYDYILQVRNESKSYAAVLRLCNWVANCQECSGTCWIVSNNTAFCDDNMELKMLNFEETIVYYSKTIECVIDSPRIDDKNLANMYTNVHMYEEVPPLVFTKKSKITIERNRKHIVKVFCYNYYIMKTFSQNFIMAEIPALPYIDYDLHDTLLIGQPLMCTTAMDTEGVSLKWLLSSSKTQLVYIPNEWLTVVEKDMRNFITFLYGSSPSNLNGLKCKKDFTNSKFKMVYSTKVNITIKLYKNFTFSMHTFTKRVTCQVEAHPNINLQVRVCQVLQNGICVPVKQPFTVPANILRKGNYNYFCKLIYPAKLPRLQISSSDIAVYGEMEKYNVKDYTYYLCTLRNIMSSDNFNTTWQIEDSLDNWHHLELANGQKHARVTQNIAKKCFTFPFITLRCNLTGFIAGKLITESLTYTDKFIIPENTLHIVESHKVIWEPLFAVVPIITCLITLGILTYYRTNKQVILFFILNDKILRYQKYIQRKVILVDKVEDEDF